MNPDLLALVLSDNPQFTLQREHAEYDKELETRNASFEMVSEVGEVIGYVKTWQDDDSFAGFVQFDSDGRVQNWKILK